MHLPPITIYDSPPPHKRSCYAPDQLPAAIYAASENYVITLTTLNDLPDLLPTDGPNTFHVMKKDMPLKGGFNRGYCCRKHGRIIWYKNTRFYCSTCSDEDKKFFKISLVTRTCFLGHQHSMSLRFGLFLCLHPFHPLLYLLNLYVLVSFLSH